MKYLELALAYKELENNSKRLRKTLVISRLLKKTKESDLEKIIMLLQGRVFTQQDGRELGVAAKLVIKAIATASGYPSNKIEDQWRKTGDLGEVAEKLISGKTQNTLFSEELTLKIVFNSLQKIATMEGHGSVDQKVKLIAKLLSIAEPLEAKYVIRTALGELRVGVAKGTLRDAVAWGYLEEIEPNYDEENDSINPENREKYNEQISAVQEAIDKTNDFLVVAKAAKLGISELAKIELKVGTPISVMLGPKAETISEAFKIVGKPAALEYKYDGFRMLVNKINDKVIIFTRRLDDVTTQFPEVKDFVLKNVDAKTCMIDCEAAGYDSNTGKYTAFQSISQRIKRKYDIEKLAKELPIELNVFDILYLDGKNVLNIPFSERRKLLEKIIKPEDKKIVLAKQIVTDDEEKAKKFFEKAVNLGNEGIMLKKLDGIYKPGSRVGYMVKYKASMDPLDVVIVGAEWGEGKRSGWLTSFSVACQSDGQFLDLGKVGTGLKEKREEGLSFDEMTELLKPLIVEEKGREVKVKPNVVVSILFDEIQKSPSYSSGYALRFPRFVVLREDRSPEDIISVDELEDLFFEQKKS